MLSIVITKGRTQQFTIAVTKDGAALNLAGAVLVFSAKTRTEDSDLNAVIRKDSAGHGIVITNQGGGLAELTIQPADTVGLTSVVTSLVCDLTLEVSGNVYTLDSGTMSVQPSVTGA